MFTYSYFHYLGHFLYLLLLLVQLPYLLGRSEVAALLASFYFSTRHVLLHVGGSHAPRAYILQPESVGRFSNLEVCPFQTGLRAAVL